MPSLSLMYHVMKAAATPHSSMSWYIHTYKHTMYILLQILSDERHSAPEVGPNLFSEDNGYYM